MELQMLKEELDNKENGNDASGKTDDDDNESEKKETRKDSDNETGYARGCCGHYHDLKNLFVSIFSCCKHRSTQVKPGKFIVNDTEKCRVLKSYDFIFAYPLAVSIGLVSILLILLIPTAFIAAIAVVVDRGLWTQFWEFTRWLLLKLLNIFGPIVMLKLFDKFVIRDTTATILRNKRIRCFSIVSVLDTSGMMGASFAMGVYDVLIGRVWYALYILTSHLLKPYQSVLPSQYHLSDDVYHSYVSTVALMSLSLLENKEQRRQFLWSEEFERSAFFLEKNKSYVSTPKRTHSVLCCCRNRARSRKPILSPLTKFSKYSVEFGSQREFSL
ncbi:hypothetical protein RFI_07887 [Reticulomyxa filosa]|uniref:Uncharacterized protein n=1 Tax=Reticulomyxa filosa TaxID=46433 RepID=X6NSG2_RETFI|nr:hypothetical protein RFI_07887 [Reticulomyxa filosa]|eukprot:ETO29235.1 hypothetical protein RFI_07887 [Reticulomyxa filosa]